MTWQGNGAPGGPESRATPTLDNTPIGNVADAPLVSKRRHASGLQHRLHEAPAAGLQGLTRIVEVQHIETGMIHAGKHIMRLGSNGVSPLADETHPGAVEPPVALGYHLLIAVGLPIQVGDRHLHRYILDGSRFVDLIDGDTPRRTALGNVGQAIQPDH